MSKFFVTGDTHGTWDMKKLYRTGRTIMKTLTPDDYLIICGDFGGVWNNSENNIKLLDWYERQPYTILFVDGNHENHTLLNEYPVEEWCGGEIHRIRSNLIHLMRGQYYTIDGKTFLTMGGAVSIDRPLRTENVNWWAAEVASEEEIATLRQTMEEHNYTVDYIITHCAPTTVLPALSPDFEQDEMTQLLDEVYYSMDFKYWYFGHYHLDKPAKQKTFCLYNEVIQLEE